MSPGTFSDLLIRLQSYKRIFVVCPKTDFLPRGKPTVLGDQSFMSENVFLGTF